MEHKIWMYWQGPMRDYISLCYKTITAHNENVVLLNRESFDKLFIADRDINIDTLAMNHQSDFIRAFLLKHYGGLYVDADCIAMKSFKAIFDRASEFGFACYRDPLGYMSCNIMASQKDGNVITDHYGLICEKLRNQHSLEWLDLASVPMDQAVAYHPDQYFIFPTELIMPLPWNESYLLTVQRQDDEHDQHFKHEAICYMLSNNTIKNRDHTRILQYMPESHILNDNYFISFLFRTSLNYQNIKDRSYLGGYEGKTLFDAGALDYLTARFHVNSMIDIGCGQPGMVYYARSKDIKAVGVDGDPVVARNCPLVIEHDFTNGPLYLGEFDLGWSVEFVEHIEEKYMANFMQTFSSCKFVFITAAIPGQSGYHHVNCQWSDYWIARFENAGFVFDQDSTNGVRSHSTMESRFTEQTGLVFRRKM